MKSSKERAERSAEAAKKLKALGYKCSDCKWEDVPSYLRMSYEQCNLVLKSQYDVCSYFAPK